MLQRQTKGFSLLEVMVSLAIFATLGVALIQTQTNNLSLLQRFKNKEPLQKEVERMVLNFEIDLKTITNFPENGAYPDSGPLAGVNWEIKKQEMNLFGFPITRVQCLVLNKNVLFGKATQSFFMISPNFLLQNLDLQMPNLKP